MDPAVPPAVVEVVEDAGFDPEPGPLVEGEVEGLEEQAARPVADSSTAADHAAHLIRPGRE
jgi:hypothetical protein